MVESLAVMATWAEQQSDRELAMLKLAIAYHMIATGQTTLRLTIEELTSLVSQYEARLTLDADRSMTFTLRSRLNDRAGG